MAGMEGIVRPFVGPGVAPRRIFEPNSKGSPPIHFSVGLRGGNKMFSFSGQSTISSYMAAVHKEAASDAFDMTTGQLAS
jgi:hypothetical protein